MLLHGFAEVDGAGRMGASDLLDALYRVQCRYDRAALDPAPETDQSRAA